MKIGIDYIGITTLFYCHDGQGNFLLHLRSKNTRDEQGTWEMGGGCMEFGETPQQTVLREMAEEYGSSGRIEEQLPAYSMIRQKDGVTSHWVCLPFIIKADPTQVKINEPEKMDQLGWFKLGQFPEPLHSGLRNELKIYAEYLNKYK